MTFPRGFLWGSASAAHQIEGNNTNNDWWEHEHASGTNAAEPSGPACDSYHRYEEDFKLVAASGQNAVRLSVEWSRIEPEPGEFSSTEFDHYRDVIGTAKDLGLTTFVTLHHFTNPVWFASRGGWEKDEAIEVFSKYTNRAAATLGDLVDAFNTINEPQVVAAVGYLLGEFPPRKTDMSAAQTVTANLIKAHGAAVESIRAECDAQVGIALSVNDYVAVEESPEAKQFRDFTHHSMTGVYLEALRSGWIKGLSVPDAQVASIAGTDDFVGIQYYTKIVMDPSALFGASSVGPSAGDEEARVTQMGWTWHPEGLGKVIDEVSEVGLPMHITENGIATDDDDERIEFVRLHLEQVESAIERGRDMRGYFYWSYLDNFEWNLGYRPKFGLISCDRKTFERKPKPSLEWYGSIATRNSL